MESIGQEIQTDPDKFDFAQANKDYPILDNTSQNQTDKVGFSWKTFHVWCKNLYNWKITLNTFVKPLALTNKSFDDNEFQTTKIQNIKGFSQCP